MHALLSLRAALAGLRPQRAVVDGQPLVVPPGVLHPVAFRTGAAFAPWVAARVGPGARLLDLGCGSGVVGVLAQRAGARVVASDLDRRACRAASDNGLPDVRQGDLFGPVRGLRFDRIAFNPPFFAGTGWLRPHRRALYGGPGWDTLRRFSAGAPRHLAPGGQAWVLLSDRAPHAARALGPGWAPVATLRPEADAGAPEELWVWAHKAG